MTMTILYGQEIHRENGLPPVGDEHSFSLSIFVFCRNMLFNGERTKDGHY
jgi:hypothetical protein